MGPQSVPGELTLLLRKWRDGDRDALSEIAERVYPELRRIARRKLAREHRASLGSAALVNEALVRLMQLERVKPEDREHLLALVTRFMLRILVDHARARRARKRGGGALHVSLHEHHRVASAPSVEILDLPEALMRLKQLHPVDAEVAELHAVGGMTFDEIAEVSGVSRETVGRRWRFAAAWLSRELFGKGDVPK